MSTTTIAEPLVVTQREKQILALLSEGRTRKQIADSIFVSFATASLEINKMLARFQCRNTTSLIVHAIKNDLI